HYRKEVNLLTTWCRDNNLLLNVSKTKEIVVDFRKSHSEHPPLTIDGAAVERVSSTKFLGVHISEDLSWAINSALVPLLPPQAQESESSHTHPERILPGDH